MFDEIQSFFSSDNPRLELERSCYMFGVPDNNIQNISSEIGLIFTDDEKLENLPEIISANLHLDENMAAGLAYEINKRIFNRFPEHFTNSQKLLDEWAKHKSEPLLTEDEAWQKVLEIEPWIAEEQRKKRREAQNIQEEKVKIEKLSLSAALQKYPEVGEQLVTTNRIMIRSFSEPARPSIKNWISDYTFTMGFDPHDSAARGIYLFQNKNTRNLNRQDQQNLSHLLRAFDTNESIEINSTLKQIVFPRLTMEKRPAPETRRSAPPIDLSPERKPAFSSNTSFQKERDLFQKTHSVGTFSGKNSPKTMPNTGSAPSKPTLSGTFTLPRKNPVAPVAVEEKRLPVGPSDMFLPSAKNDLPKKSTLEFSSPQRLPFEKQMAAPVKQTPIEKIERPEPEPMKIVPRNFKRDPIERKISLPKNVVNLKEE